MADPQRGTSSYAGTSRTATSTMIPAGARHGKPWHQFAFWLGGNVNVFNVVLGAVVVVDRADLLVGADRHRRRDARSARC